MKRSLSEFEKSTLDPTQLGGLGLILPAEAGTEVEELHQVGMGVDRIRCIERDEAKADLLYEAYFDQLTVHCIAIEDFIPRARRSSYSYVHLDYCGHLDGTNTDTLARCGDIMWPHSRLRATLARNRKSAKQSAHEELIFDTLLVPLATQVSIALGEDPDALLADLETARGDASAAAVTVILIGTVLGWPIWEYADRNVTNTASFEISPRFWPTDIQRFRYADTANWDMETLWVDLLSTARMRRSANRESFLRNLLMVISLLPNTPPTYHPHTGEEP